MSTSDCCPSLVDCHEWNFAGYDIVRLYQTATFLHLMIVKGASLLILLNSGCTISRQPTWMFSVCPRSNSAPAAQVSIRRYASIPADEHNKYLRDYWSKRKYEWAIPPLTAFFSTRELVFSPMRP
jgi:hypothetical protein